MKKVVIKVGGMTCSACSNHVAKYLNKQEHVIDATVNLVLGQATIYMDDKINLKDISRYVEESGYIYEGIFREKDILKENKTNKNILILMTILAIMVMYISMGPMTGLPIPNILSNTSAYILTMSIFSIIFLLYGKDILKNGIKNIINLSPNMYSLVSIGLISSIIYTIINIVLIIRGNHHLIHDLYFEAICIVIYFVKLGKFIESNAKEKTKDALKDLVSITPEKAILLKKDKEIETTIDEVKVKDLLIVKPGMRVAVDGIIKSGSAHFDESFITGESISKKKKKGESIVAGSINLDGVVEYEATKIGPKSTISEIVRLVIDASNSKTDVERLADKISGIFVPTIILIAIITLIGYLILGFNIEDAINSFITVLLVACPCALGLATPLAIVVSVGIFSRKNILVKNASTIEELSKIDTIIFDKTGTLTKGNLEVSKIFNFTKKKDDEILDIIANLEENSTHPIGNAFKKYKVNDLFVSDFKNISGIGLKGTIKGDEYYLGNAKLFEYLKIENEYEKEEFYLTNHANSICYLIKNNKVLALTGVKDIIRDDIKKLIFKLKKLNLDVIMLTGDNTNTANVIAKEIGINKIYANVLPKEKYEIIDNLKKENKHIMMIGDGINDAPALTTANVGVSISSGTDIAASSSDIIILNDDLHKIIDILRIGKSTISKIKSNLFFAFLYNIIMIPIAIGLFKQNGLVLNPMIASLAMMLSSITVIVNTLILRVKEKRYEKNSN